MYEKCKVKKTYLETALSVLRLNTFQELVRVLMNLQEVVQVVWTFLCIESCWNNSNPIKLHNAVFCLEGENKGTTEIVLVLEQSLCGMKCLDAGLWESL